MHILVTNDDGVQAPGLLALAEALQPLGRITVLAPDRNWSMTGHIKSLDRPLRVKQVTLANGTPAFSCDGAPSDCVALALLGFLEQPPEFVVSGINPYANLGHDLTYSGTVTAAMEGAIGELPAVAVSMDGNDDPLVNLNYWAAAAVARRVVKTVIEGGLPRYVLLNVNVPNLPIEKIRGYKVTRQGKRIYRDILVKREDPRGNPYCWISGEPPTGVPEEDSDIGALAEGYVSIMPVQLDLTAHHLLANLRTWNWNNSNAAW